MSELTVSPSVVSPNGDGYDDLLVVSYALSGRAAVTATLTSAEGALIATLFRDQRQSARRHRFSWPLDVVPDGRYTVTITARGDDGRAATRSASVTVLRTLASVAVMPPVFSPDGDGVDDSATISFVLSREAHVALEVRRQGVTLALIFVGTLGPGAQAFLWDGSLPDGRLPPGRYEVVVTATDAVGAVSQAAPFEIEVGPG